VPGSCVMVVVLHLQKGERHSYKTVRAKVWSMG
jgi:hypothetical protein